MLRPRHRPSSAPPEPTRVVLVSAPLDDPVGVRAIVVASYLTVPPFAPKLEGPSMIRRLIPSLFLTLSLASAAPAAFTTTFEDAGLASNSADNNSGPAGGFAFNGNFLNNTYGTSGPFEFWSGWSISTMTDTTTKGFGNQYSAIAGSGAGGSATYAVADAGESPGTSYINLASAPISVAITNTTYSYFSIKDGDQFARPFGAGDYFVLDIQGYDGLAGEGNSLGTISYVLADYRNGLSSILSTWATIDLSPLGNARSLLFGLRSTNTGDFGINNPTYFALDNLVVASPAAVPEPASLALVASGLIGVVALGRRRARAAR
jgi:hypothetical protein